MRAAVIQMNSTADRDRNHRTAARLLAEAGEDGADLAVLPEKWPFFTTGRRQSDSAEAADGPSLTAARGWARDLGLTLVAGSITIRAEAGERPRNTTFVISPEGEVIASFDKLHLFDVDAGGVAYRESEFEAPGDGVTVFDLPGETGPALRCGLGICYDLRFPELFRAIADRGADLVALPSGFTAATGRVHWEPLLRARAIENQVFMLAANQWGRSGDSLHSWGHSMIVDPWGEVLAAVEEGEGFACAELDFERQATIRRDLPVLDHRRPELQGGRDGS